MAIIFLQEKRTQKSLVVVLFVILAITAFIIWNGFFRKGMEIAMEEELGASKKEISINYGVLGLPTLEKLQPFLEIEPLEEATPTEEQMEYPEEVGRENPFVPY